MDNQASSTTVYDFQNPGHKLNTNWPVLELVGNGIASSFASGLSDVLQLPFQGEAQGIRRLAYQDCLSSLGNTCVIQETSMSPLPGKAWFCMDTSVISAIVESYFGGDGQVAELSTPRALSHTELRVLKHILGAVVVAIDSGWAIVKPVQTAVVRQVPIKRLINTARQPIMVVNDMSLKHGNAELPYQLIYPYDMLEPLGAQLEAELEEVVTQDSLFSTGLRRELMLCELEIRGVLAESQITLGKLLELKPGDFIPLRDLQNVSFKSNNMPLFDAHVGSSNGRVSASLSRWHLPVTS